MQNDSNLNNSIVFKDVTKQYTGTMRPALSHINLSVKKGEFVCLVGPSGEGKSTLLKLIAGLEKETEGVIEKPEIVSMAFQTIALFPWLSVFDNVAIGLQTKGVDQKEVHKETMKYIHMMNLDMFVDQKPADLSGGQRQRVGIARALAVNPDVLLLDEPFSALDPKTTAELHDDIIRIWKETGKTIVMVSHLIEEAVSLAERIFLIKQGELAHTFTIDLPYPRRDQEEHFMHEVGKVRKEFFK